MTGADHIRIYGLFNQAMQVDRDRFEFDPSSVGLFQELERMVTRANSRNDNALGYHARLVQVIGHTLVGDPKTALTAYSWCQDFHHLADTGAEDFVLLAHECAAYSMLEVPQYPREQVIRTIDRWSKLSGSRGRRSVIRLRATAAMDMGDRSGAAQYLKDWDKNPRDEMSDCPACELQTLIEVQKYLGQDAQAIRTAAGLLRRKLFCDSVPHMTYGTVLVPMLRLGRLKQALQYDSIGYRRVRKRSQFLTTVAEHLMFRTLGKSPMAAARLFEEHLPWALASTSLKGRFHFFRAASLLFAECSRANKTTIKLRLPDECAKFLAGNAYSAERLLDWSNKNARNLADQFDKRNGNDWYHQQIAATDELARFARGRM